MSLGRHPAKRVSELYHLTPVVARSLRPRVPRRLLYTKEESTMKLAKKKIVKKTTKKVVKPPAPAKKPEEEEKVKLAEEGKNDKTEQFNVLAHQRGLAKGKLTKMLHSISGDAQLSVALLKAYQRKVDATYDEFYRLHEQILQIVPASMIDDQDIIFTVFDDLHMTVLTIIEEQMEMLNKRTQGSGSTAPSPVVVQQPLKIPIPSFDGKYENWSKFKVMFKDLVDKTADPPFVKLYHLDKALVGSAAGTIDAKTINEGNYKYAWEILEEKYENLRHNVDYHIRGLFALPRMTGEKCEELRKLVDACSGHVENLKFLKQEFTGVSKQFVVHLLAEALDKNTRRRWESTVRKGELPDYEATIQFLKEQAFIMERCDDVVAQDKPEPVKKSTVRYPTQQSLATTSSNEVMLKCDVCNDNQHRTWKCPRFLEMPVPQRLVKARERNMCFNCLRTGHISSRCTSNGSCGRCQKRHHSLLHAENQQATEEQQKNKHLQVEQQDDQQQSETTQVTTAACSSGQAKLAPHVLLMTAVVDIMDKNSRPHPCRILLDSASQVNIITQRMVDLLGVDDFHANVSIAGVDGMQSRSNRGVEVQLRSRYMEFRINVQCFVTQRVTSDLPTSNVDISSWEIPAEVHLADPEFHSPEQVDMLIGNQWFLKLLRSGKIQLAEDLPTLCETKFGWVLGGAIGGCAAYDGVVRAQATTIEDLSASIQRFWEVESVPEQFQVSTEEEECEKHFLATHRRNAAGRYVVELPLKKEVEEINDNRSLALRRFFVLEKKFEHQPDLKWQYQEFMQEYEDLGHCKEVSENNDPPGLKKWYLPHHAVLRPSNTTTKCRVVFDASAKISGRSLNEVLKVGAINQNDLLSIVLAFRIPRYVLTADVAKMYRQIEVSACHTPLQRIFWRRNPTDPLRVLELTTVTYGTASAPFLATRAVAQLAADGRSRFPLAADIIEKCFYVDNALFGFDELSDALEAQRQLMALMESGGFHLHKWSANDAVLLQGIPQEDREKLVSISESGANEIIKTLGLMWNPESDELLFLSLPTSDIQHPTKRQILSLVSQMFDPLGLVAPVILIGKLLMQKVWKAKLNWDKLVSEALLKDWKNFVDALEGVDQLRIPRRVLSLFAIAFELHGYSDASMVAYGVCVYIRCIFSDGSATMVLILAKTRVAPIDAESIPRLELLGALLLHRVVLKLLPAINVRFREMVLWSDSQVLLAWLKKPLQQLELFVRNRVREITSTKDLFTWRYVSTKDNPADVVTRGLTARQLALCVKFWNGPTYMQLAVYQMEIPPPLPDEDIPELKAIVNVVTAYEKLPVFEKYANSFRKLQRILAYVLRFRKNGLKRKEDRTTSQYPTIGELREATKTIVRVVQNEDLSGEIQRALSNEPCKYINNLSPFLEDGLLRVGGRLRNSRLPYSAKHQWILPSKNPIVRGLIVATHQENLHVGPSGVMAALRQRFWVVNCRNTVRFVTRSCVKCFKQNPRLAEQFMGELPSSRVERAPAFSKVGVDFAGPIMIRQGIRRVIPVKGYICVFICLVTKAIHLEAVENLSTAAFLAALKRFTARRGIPEEIWSDNGTNFVGARNELKELSDLFRSEMMERGMFEFCQPRQIAWKMIPPRAPHFGGLWEAGVKSVKTVLNKVFRQAGLNIVEFATLLCQIEAILNSRPLFPHSNDPNDQEVLTPGHFLVDRPLTALPEPSCDGIQPNRLSRWQHVQALRDHFWNRWRKEYVVELQARAKWTRRNPNIKPGMMVLVKEDNLPPQTWRLGRVERTVPGPDNLVRVADVRTKSGTLTRPIHKLALLPIPDNESPISQ